MGSNKVIQGVNDLETYCKQNGKEDLLKEWHPTKNGDLKPADVACHSSNSVWWYLPYDDSRTGKHFDFEWKATVDKRVSGRNCPYLGNPMHKIYIGFNDLATTNPEIAKEWNYKRNGNLIPTNVTAGSIKKVWWYLPYEDIKTGKHFDFEWEATIQNRVKGSGCPYLSGDKVLKGFNDLETLYPDLAKEWHPTKNDNLKPSDVTAGSNKKVWWYLSYDDVKTGKHFDFEWEATIVSRVKGNGCPFVSGQKLRKGYNDLESLYPNIAREWHPTKNGELKPSDVLSGSEQKVWWYLPYDDVKTGKHFDFEWEATIYNRVNGSDCPYLSKGNARVWKGYNDLETIYPNISKEWHPIKNGILTPSNVTVRSGKKVWWQGKCNHEWKARIADRVEGRDCPYCSGSKTEKLLYTYCKENEISFVAEKKFNDIPIKFYPYDLYLYKHKLVIEADGKQHFESIEFFEKETKFEDRIKRDNIKNEYCLTHKIPILRIPYTYDVINDKPKIENIVNEFIKTRKVPQEILEFYKSYKESIGSNYYDVASALNELE